ncbi:hypothetical protein [Pararobbsia alpina]|uniref:Lipoprotein n=1 Tax=Pararobbsia alpina TaxID=621374 RepID=A0A6S7BLL8_9BURK|nr:hypothetical protein [Pararobbsia alpina]CAB3804868.1 hypothetical protein LMG28138_05584 [Pararobbsia alpina]
MKGYIFSALASAVILSGCATPPPTHLNSSGRTITFSNPILLKEDVAKGNLTYVLVEESIADGSLHIASISKARQSIQNERQERIVFNSDLTKFAPDFEISTFYTYSDAGNYNEKTVVMNCMGHLTKKTQEYSPCSSVYGSVFVPMGVYKAGAAGAAVDTSRWENPHFNFLRVVASPEYTLRKAGVFDHLDQLTGANNEFEPNIQNCVFCAARDRDRKPCLLG